MWYPTRSRLLSRASLRLRTALQSRLARRPPKRRSRHDSSRPRGLMYPVHEHLNQRRFRFASQKKPLHSSFPRSIPCCTQSRPKPNINVISLLYGSISGILPAESPYYRRPVLVTTHCGSALQRLRYIRGSRNFEIHLEHSLPSTLWIRLFPPYRQILLRDLMIASAWLAERRISHMVKCKGRSTHDQKRRPDYERSLSFPHCCFSLCDITHVNSVTTGQHSI